ncbi:MAG: hypothetical protein FJW30_21400 [Acidobacteria bacterium]|nr:hypothetical protein [Acidobacteriota bacterium]
MSLRTSWLAIGLSAFAPVLLAQGGMTCTASAPNPAFMRSNGIAELAGEVIITCRGGTPVTSGALPVVTVNMFFNTAITSRVLANPPGAPALNEAVMIIDSPAAADQRPCLNLAACLPTDNLFQGRFESFNSTSWVGIPVNPPGPNADRILRFRNLRLNANTLPPNGQALVFVSMTGAQVTGSLANPQLTIGNVRPGVNLEMRSAADATITAGPTLTACTGYNADLAANAAAAAYSTPGGRSLLVRFTEGFPNAFKKRLTSTTLTEPLAVAAQDNPAGVYTSESGFFNPALPATNGLNRMGLADSGTPLRVSFTNLPVGVRLFVGTREFGTGSTLDVNGNPTTKARLTGTPGAPFSAIAPDNQIDGGLKQVPANGEMTWEVLDTDPNNIESVSFVVVIAFGGTPQPAAGTGTLNGGFGPQSANPAAGTTDPMPRFQGVVGPPLLLFTVNACRTSLLFQFITNQAGFDTGIAVSNTSRDILNTATQVGRCVATFFPTPFNATTQAQFPALTSPILAGGEQWAFTVSGQRPGFQGYMMVNCDFQFAHGYAFISDFGSKNLAQGYQALVVPDRPRAADPFSTAGPGSGEQLVH